MRIGIPRETKEQEGRVGITPAGVHELVDAEHSVVIQSGAGEESGISDQDYERRGARITRHAAEVWDVDMVIKVKEPLAEEYGYLRPGLILFTYLHLAAEPELAQTLLRTRTIAIAYETVQLPDGELPLLTPMSEVAGRMAIQEGAFYLKKTFGGKGTLLGGVTGVPPAMWSSSAGVSSAPMPPRWPSAWEPRWPYWRRAPGGWPTWTTSSTAE